MQNGTKKYVIIFILYSLLEFFGLKYIVHDPENLIFLVYSPFFIIFPLFYGINGAILVSIESIIAGLLFNYFYPNYINLETSIIISLLYFISGVLFINFGITMDHLKKQHCHSYMI